MCNRQPVTDKMNEFFALIPVSSRFSPPNGNFPIEIFCVSGNENEENSVGENGKNWIENKNISLIWLTHFLRTNHRNLIIFSKWEWQDQIASPDVCSYRGKRSFLRSNLIACGNNASLCRRQPIMWCAWLKYKKHIKCIFNPHNKGRVRIRERKLKSFIPFDLIFIKRIKNNEQVAYALCFLFLRQITQFPQFTNGKSVFVIEIPKMREFHAAHSDIP